MMKKNKQPGFTLIEVMIVVAIMGIVTTIAVAYYGDFIIAAKREDGRETLQNTATALEKCKLLYGAYNSGNCSIANGDTIASIDGLYDISVVSTITTYTFTATPSAGSSQNNDKYCDSIILDQLGLETGTGPDWEKACW